MPDKQSASLPMDTNPPSNGAILPDDILIRIFAKLDEDAHHWPPNHQCFDEFTYEHTFSPKPRTLITSISHVCRLWNTLAQRQIYTSVTLVGKRNIDSFNRILEKNPNLGLNTNTLFLRTSYLFHRSQEEEEEEEIGFPYIYEECKAQEEGITTEFFSLLPNLRQLCICNDWNRQISFNPAGSVKFPPKLDLLCLHGITATGATLSQLPQGITQLSCTDCRISTLQDALQLPNLRTFKLLSHASMTMESDWGLDSFKECPSLTALSVDLGLPSQESLLPALAKLLPHLETLRIGTHARSVDLVAWFSGPSSNLRNLVIDGSLSTDAICALPASLESITGREAGINNISPVNTMLGQLRRPEKLPNLRFLPAIELDGMYLMFSASSVDADEVAKTYRFLTEERGLAQAGGVDGNDSLSLWQYFEKRRAKESKEDWDALFKSLPDIMSQLKDFLPGF